MAHDSGGLQYFISFKSMIVYHIQQMVSSYRLEFIILYSFQTHFMFHDVLIKILNW